MGEGTSAAETPSESAIRWSWEACQATDGTSTTWYESACTTVAQKK